MSVEGEDGPSHHLGPKEAAVSPIWRNARSSLSRANLVDASNRRADWNPARETCVLAVARDESRKKCRGTNGRGARFNRNREQALGSKPVVCGRNLARRRAAVVSGRRRTCIATSRTGRGARVGRVGRWATLQRAVARPSFRTPGHGSTRVTSLLSPLLILRFALAAIAG